MQDLREELRKELLKELRDKELRDELLDELRDKLCDELRDEIYDKDEKIQILEHSLEDKKKELDDFVDFAGFMVAIFGHMYFFGLYSFFSMPVHYFCVHIVFPKPTE